MCNNLHQDAVKVNCHGWAWKIFRPTKSWCGSLRPMMHPRDELFPLNKWIEWDPAFTKGDGFTAFRTLHEAQKFVRDWLWDLRLSINYIVKRIRVRRVLGEQNESKIIPGLTHRIIIVKEFMIPSDSSTFLVQDGKVERVKLLGGKRPWGCCTLR